MIESQNDYYFKKLEQLVNRTYTDKVSPLELDNLMKSLVKKFKAEFYRLLKTIDDSKVNYVIAEYKYVFQAARENTYPDRGTIDKYLVEFNVSLDKLPSTDNKLGRILLINKYDEYIELGAYREDNIDVSDIRKEFFQFYKAKHLNNILEFIDSFNSIQNPISTATMKKINLNLSVSEFAYIIRLLDDCGYIKEDDKEYRKILTDTFSTKKAVNISIKSFKNKFNTPDPSAVGNVNSILKKLLEFSDENY